MATSPETKLLRVITCGSVDDGKSTLIGRLLHDTSALLADQLDTLAADSKRVGTQGDALDFALLVDGLSAEREQGITIDVAYRFFATPAAKFIIADCPGHVQYTRNMVTGASTADAAIILVDARKGVLEQTRRHAWLVHLMGIRHIVLAVNKMDLVGYDRVVFDRHVLKFRAFASALGITRFQPIPISGFRGDNIAEASPAMPWYAGPSLVAHLESLEPGASDSATAFRLPVQWVARPGQDFRGFAGQIVSGQVAPGDAVRILPSGRTTHVARIVAPSGDLDRAGAGQSVMLTLADEVDVSRGGMIVASDTPPQVADRFEATLIWMDETALVPGRSYLMKLATQTIGAVVQQPKYRWNVNTSEKLAARTLDLNDIGVVEIATGTPIVFAPFADEPALGRFILIDRTTHATVAGGLIHFALRRSTNIYAQPLDITREMLADLKNQKAAVVWFTGLSGAGKSTIANLVAKRLHRANRHVFVLDGDNVRHGLNRDLGFTEADRIENIRRVGEVARLMTDAGLIVIAAFISPYRADRELVRAMLPPGEFVEVFVDTPLADAEARDVKGLYAKARAGDLKNFTGIDSPYEAPEAPELRIDTRLLSPDEAAALVVERLLG